MNSRIPLLAIVLSTMIVMSACSNTAPTPPSTATPSPPSTASPVKPAHDTTPPRDDQPSSESSPSTQTDPKIELRITSLDDSADRNYTAEATVTCRTGGWDIASDSAQVIDGKLTWRVTITRPAPGEIVTQAFQTRTITHAGHDGPVQSAELLARVVVRDHTPSQLYSDFATWP